MGINRLLAAFPHTSKYVARHPLALDSFVRARALRVETGHFAYFAFFARPCVASRFAQGNSPMLGLIGWPAIAAVNRLSFNHAAVVSAQLLG